MAAAVAQRKVVRLLALVHTAAVVGLSGPTALLPVAAVEVGTTRPQQAAAQQVVSKSLCGRGDNECLRDTR